METTLEKIQQNKSKVMCEQATAFLKRNVLDQMNNTQIINLVDAGCDINVPDKNGETLLGYAVKEGNLELTDNLLQKGAKLDVKSVNYYDRSSIVIPYIALKLHHGEGKAAFGILTTFFTPILIGSIAGAVVNELTVFKGMLLGGGLSLFLNFVIVGCYAMDGINNSTFPWYFSKRYFDISRRRIKQKIYPLELAIQNKNTMMIEKLSEYAKGQENRILMERMEAEQKRQMAIQKVKDKTKKVFSFVPTLMKNVYNAWQVRVATKRLANFNFVKGKAEDFENLIARGANVNVLDRTKTPLLLVAAEKKRADILGILLDNDVPVNVQNEKGWSALMFMAQAGDSKMVQRLLDAGADVTLTNDYGKTALMYGAKSGRSDIVKGILKCDSETMEVLDKENKTALFYGVQSGDKDTVQAFLDEDVNADVVDKSGKTNLMYATRNNKYMIAKMLLDYGVATDVVDNTGKNAWDYVKKNDTKAVALLEANLKPWKDKLLDDLNKGKKESALTVLKKQGFIEEKAEKVVGVDIKHLGNNYFAVGQIFETTKEDKKYWHGEVSMVNLEVGRGLSLETKPVLVHTPERFRPDVTDIPTKDFLKIRDNQVVVSLGNHTQQGIDLPDPRIMTSYARKIIQNTNEGYARA